MGAARGIPRAAPSSLTISPCTSQESRSQAGSSSIRRADHSAHIGQVTQDSSRWGETLPEVLDDCGGRSLLIVKDLNQYSLSHSQFEKTDKRVPCSYQDLPKRIQSYTTANLPYWTPSHLSSFQERFSIRKVRNPSVSLVYRGSFQAFLAIHRGSLAS